MKTKQDYLNLLEETVSYYTKEKNNRSTQEGSCFYYKDGNMCAVGRCLTNPKDKDSKLGVLAVYSLFKEDIFKDEYRGFDIDFWTLLQDLHDRPCNWDKFKLTVLGETKVNDIKNWINRVV